MRPHKILHRNSYGFKRSSKKASRNLGIVVVSLLFLESLCVSATLSGLSPEMIVALA